ncbi:MFS transporter [Ferrovibrio sp.]|uniref:MFS transporter n=1 Tax=Ferrovibrio sp. TaxID=1917215 RepID=UPI003D26E408
MLGVIFLSVVVDLIGFGIVLPLLPFYAISFGATPATVALLAAVFSIAQFLTAPLLGALTDRVGRRPVFLACLVVSCCAYIGLAFADSLVAIFLARIFAGIGAGKIGIAQAIIADSTTPETRAKGMGMVGAAFGIGMILGPVLGGLLTGPDPLNPNYHLPAFAAAAASLAAFGFALWRLPETRRPGNAALPPASRNPLKHLDKINRIALGLILVQFSINFVFAQIEVLFPLFARARFDWHAFEVGIAFACIGCIVLAMQGGLIGPLSRRFGENNLLRIGILGLSFGTLLVVWVVNVPMLALSVLFTASSFAMINPSLASLISRAADPEHQGLTMGAAQSFAALGRVLGPLLGGYLFETVSLEAPYIAGGVLLLLTLVVFYRPIKGNAG